MKLVVAVIRQDKVEGALAALEKRGLHQVTITPVFGCGHQKPSVIAFRGVIREERKLPRFKLEIAVDERWVHEAIDAIGESAHTGEIGDGVIWVSNLEQFVRVRTGEAAARPPFPWTHSSSRAG